LANAPDLYQRHLDGISRSFAFCIVELEEPLRRWVGLSYILCRLADTIEDSPWPARAPQTKSYEQFVQFIEVLPAREHVNAWAAEFPELPDPAEAQLLEEAYVFFVDLHALEAAERQAIQSTVHNMLRGMRHFSECYAEQSEMRLRTLSEVNGYCFFVAGVVGELLTNLVALQAEEVKQDPNALLDAIHFGLFLQKINILKDQMKDEREGRHLVPSRPAVRDSLIENAQHAFSYIQRIPVRLKGYRIFCAWSFFLGLLSLPWIERSWQERRDLKISRLEAWAYLTRIKRIIDDNQALQKEFEQMASRNQFDLVQTKKTSLAAEATFWHTLYQGRLQEQDFVALGLTSP